MKNKHEEKDVIFSGQYISGLTITFENISQNIVGCLVFNHLQLMLMFLKTTLKRKSCNNWQSVSWLKRVWR